MPSIVKKPALVYPVKKDIEETQLLKSKNGELSLFEELKFPTNFDLSIILPMYNVENYVGHTISSLASQFDISIQTIIINDGATDQSLDVAIDALENEGIKNAVIISQPNKGLSASRNNGLKYALGEFVAFLDTDDFMLPNAYPTMVNFAKKQNLDLVFCGSKIFNHENFNSYPFYDKHVWSSIMNGQNYKITNAAKDPDVLLLEPNACTRITRRNYILRENLLYPEGLYFEDMPAHIKAILSTNRIGLVNSPFFRYRINRPGKITEDRSSKRFDVIFVLDKTLQVTKNIQLNSTQGGNLLFSLLRITYWCGTKTTIKDRKNFYRKLSKRFQAIDINWITAFNHKFKDEMDLVIQLWALHNQEINFLYWISLGRKPKIVMLKFFMATRRWRNIYYFLKSKLSPKRILYFCIFSLLILTLFLHQALSLI